MICTTKTLAQERIYSVCKTNKLCLEMNPTEVENLTLYDMMLVIRRQLGVNIRIPAIKGL